MPGSNTVDVFSADSDEPYTLHFEVRGYQRLWRSIPYVLYTSSPLDTAEQASAARIALFLAGGGSSGVLFAKVAELLQQDNTRVYMLDLPGHSPDNLFSADNTKGQLLPERRWLRYLSSKLRKAIIEEVLQYCLAQASGRPIDIITHSAGFIDASQIDPRFAARIRRFYLMGTGVPGTRSMKAAMADAEKNESSSQQSLWQIIKTRSTPTGEVAAHFGPPEIRSTDESILASYQGNENIALIFKLLQEKTINTDLWQNADIKLLSSQGDGIAPPKRITALNERLQSMGASTEQFVLESRLPHMFMMFDEGARFVYNVIKAS